MEYLKVVLINMISILMASAKLPTPGLLKIKIYCYNCYNAIIYAYGLISKVFSRDSNYTEYLIMLATSNYIEYVIMLPKF